MIRKEILAAISASLSVITVGIDFGWPSHAIPKLLDPTTSAVDFTNNDGPLLISTGFICGMVAFPVATYLFNKIGRKYALLLSAIPHVLGWVIIGTLYHQKLFIFIGRGCVGFGDSMVFLTLPFYLAEISSDYCRGANSSLFAIMYNIGALISCSVGPFLPFHVFPYVAIMFIPIFVITFLFMPETPHYYVLKEEYGVAMESLKELRRPSTKAIDAEFQSIKGAVSENLSAQPSICELFSEPHNRKAFFIVCVMATLEQFSGITAILFYCQKLFSSSEYSLLPANVSAIIFASVFLFGAFLTTVTVDKIGRKMLALISCSGCFVCLSFLGAYFYIQVEMPTVDVRPYNWIPLALIIPYVVFAVVGLVNIPMILMGELFHAKFKAVGSVLFGIYMSLIIMAATKVFQYTSDEIALYVPFWIFALNCLFGVLFSKFYMIETKNKTLANIQKELRRGENKRKIPGLI
ncbi:facilitated trehalose transporter Tret1-like [Chrysoperla carnea]|uniref:facilitated trehalose transporter Tret1-like n=1 Tax=Chrysoperla carnea TaxID=189513 RepID=UPI001D066E76|nr:facilitated trehalose transporter Tret1-like [Chrysoperla carnea]